MKTVHVHFVCTGNYYRSRLAEAYLKSKMLPDIKVSSSGIQAKKYYVENGPISWYAARLIKRHKLIPHTKPMSTQTTPKRLNTADIVVFMTDKQYEYAKSTFKYQKNSFEIWHIGDINEAGFFNTERDSEMMRIEHTEKTFSEITKKVDDLVKWITHANR